MHPVLADAVLPLCEAITRATAEELHSPAGPESDAWTGQQIVEHLFLAFTTSTYELRTRLRKGDSPNRSGSFLQWIARTQVCWFHSMPSGIRTTRSMTPGPITPQTGPELAARLMTAAEDLNRALADSRIAFGLRPCGYHLVYGPMRVEEWRVYHAVHCLHHHRQFREAIAAARLKSAKPA